MLAIKEVITEVRERKNTPLSEDEIRLCAMLMRRVKFEPYAPLEIFMAWESSFYDNAVELAVIKKGTNGIEILLTQREHDDPFYPGEYHVPGAIIIPGKRIRDTLTNLIDREVGVDIGQPIPVQLFEFLKAERPRGQGFCFLHMALVSDEVAAGIERGAFFSIDELPAPMLEQSVVMIKRLRELLE